MSEQPPTQPIRQSPPPSPPVTLDYQRLERARKVAIGGLRLLGILISAIAMVFFLILPNQIRLLAPGSIRQAAIPLSVMGIALILGIIKFTCSLFIARRSRTAAILALLVVLSECLGILCLFIATAIHFRNDTDEPLAFQLFIMSLLCCVLLGWLAVAYEIIQILRLEKSSTIASP